MIQGATAVYHCGERTDGRGWSREFSGTTRQVAGVIELVRATGRLADPTDLVYSEDHLQDPDTLTLAIDSLLARKPHLACRKPVEEIGQGATPSAGTVDLAGMLRQRAR